jgi:Ran GTPase-activating protein 1
MKLLVNNRTIKTLKLNNNGLGIGGAGLIATALIEAHEKNKESGTDDKLQVFMAGRNRMESPGIISLAKALGKYTSSFEKLHVPQNSIRPDGVVVMMEELKGCSKLHTLDLQDNTFTESGSLSLSKVIENWPNLHTLHLGDCLLSAKGAIHVIKSLTTNHKDLVNIHLGFNEIDESGAQLVPAMLENKTKLKKIELNGNCFEADCDAVEAIQAVLSMLGCVDALDYLDEMDVDGDDDDEEGSGDDDDGAGDGKYDKVLENSIDELADAIKRI